MAALYTAIETPVIIPLLYLTIALWPIVWVMNWLSYLNGSAHRSTHKESFAGNGDAWPARFLCSVHATRPARRPGPGDARDDPLRRHCDPAGDYRPDLGRGRRPGQPQLFPRPASTSAGMCPTLSS